MPLKSTFFVLGRMIRVSLTWKADVSPGANPTVVIKRCRVPASRSWMPVYAYEGSVQTILFPASNYPVFTIRLERTKEMEGGASGMYDLQ